MKTFHSSQIFSYNQMQSALNLCDFTKNLSEKEIITLNEIFLSPGLHVVKIKNVRQGRSIFDVFVQQLHFYALHDCCALVQGFFHTNDCNSFDLSLLSQLTNDELDVLLLSLFDYNLLWIEADQNLLSNDKFTKFESRIYSLKLYEKLPIIVMLCDE